MNPEDNVTTAEDLKIVAKYEAEIIEKLKDIMIKKADSPDEEMHRRAGYMAGLCSAITAMAIGAFGPDEGLKYVSAGINRAAEGVKRINEKRQ